MAISGFGDESRTLLFLDTVDGSVNYRGIPAVRTFTGGWRSAGFIICGEVAERFAYFGILSNLITYLTGPLGESTATAAANVNAWDGMALLLPLVWGFIADSFLGRFRTILLASSIYILGLALLTFSAMIPSINSSDCKGVDSCPSQFQVIIFFSALYMVAIAQGGFKPCVQAFGADQFDSEDPEECKAKSSFFNWWFFGSCAGTLVTLLISNYIQDNLSWVLGFGIPCLAMVVAMILFSVGIRTYRFNAGREEQRAFVRIGNVFVAASKNWRTPNSAVADAEDSLGFCFLNKALVGPPYSCSITDIEEAKAMLRLIPIWITCLVYAIVFGQTNTFFTKQGATMDRSITSGFKIPAATLQSFINIAVVVFIPIYDRVFIPIARSFTGKPTGITVLQKIGVGMILPVSAMIVAALVEMKRRKTAEDYGLVDLPDAVIPMKVWWLVPQYVLLGISEVFAMVGLQELFYDQIPNDLKSVGLSLYLSIFGMGNFLSSFMISVIDKATKQYGERSWFADNLNRGHLDYFYWLLAALSSLCLALFLYFAKSYIYHRSTITL